MRRGLTVIEVMITAAVLAVGILVIVTTFSMNLRQSSQTRERVLADLVMENLIEEVLAHPYGDPAPATWQSGEVSFDFIVEGRAQQSRFVRNVTTNEDTGNGSFLGGADSSVDVVTLTVTWTEATNPGDSGNDRQLSLDLTVRREL